VTAPSEAQQGIAPRRRLGTVTAETQSPGSAIKAGWRSDIDGLRALAIVPVVIFHIAQSLLSGGYAGVDVFFVISGYLISRNIFSEIEAGRFGIAHFYEHRLRRIFPAYSVVLLAMIGLSLLHDLPSESRAFGATLLAALGSVSNIHFFFNTDYFSTFGESQSLLHTWSLSVEEQFYLILPILVLVLYQRNRRRLEWTLVGLFALSLAFSIPAAFGSPLAAFYLLAARAWELLLGSLLALGLVRVPENRAAREALAAAGLVLIVGSMALLTPLTPFPGAAAIPPCLGTAMIIAAGERGDSAVSRILSWTPFTFLGAISYSLYLWHWPVLVAHHTGLIFSGLGSKMLERGAVLALSLLLAVLSWWLIERTTRNRRLVPTRALLAGSAAMVALICGAGFVLLGTSGLPGRFSSDAVAAAAYLEYSPAAAYREGRCFLQRTDSFTDLDRQACLPNVEGRPNYLLIGDSHAAHLYPGLRATFADANILQVTGVLCPPTIPLQPVVSRSCDGLMRLATEQLPTERRITKVWLSAAWNGSLSGTSPGWRSEWLQDLEHTVKIFRKKGIEAVIIGPSPEFSSPLPRLLALEIEEGDSGRAARAERPDPRVLDRRLSAFAREMGLAYVSLFDALCQSGNCPTLAAPGVPLTFDASHFTEEGSILAVSRLAGALR
jgi:peptidoglycan/LPS O-acetylase OafA/YrhL